MNEPGTLPMDRPAPPPAPVAERWLRRLAHFVRYAALAGLLAFGAYIALRATGATFKNFEQWRALVGGLPMTASDWVANLGIGLHFVMGTVLVLAWPILLSARIRARHRAVHRWTGRVYVSAGFLAGVGGMSFILTHGAYTPAASLAFGIWGAVLMLSAAMAYLHARAKRFDLHRAWAIRLFAMVLGSWVFDLEFRAWKDLTGGIGIGAGTTSGLFDYAILYLFFVPNLLVAEFFIRNQHKRIVLPRHLAWPAVGGGSRRSPWFSPTRSSWSAPRQAGNTGNTCCSCWRADGDRPASCAMHGASRPTVPSPCRAKGEPEPMPPRRREVPYPGPLPRRQPSALD